MNMNTTTSQRANWSMMPLLCVLLCFAALPASAQDEPATDPSASETMEQGFGVKGGVNWSNLRVKDVNDNNARFGFHAGVFGRFASSQSLGFQIEALYDQKGTTIKKTFGTVDQELTYKFDYITVPAFLVIPLGEVLELHGGAFAGYMVLSEVTSKGDLGDGSSDPQDSEFHGFDYGLVGGAGVNLGMAQIGARYQHGLGEIAGNAVSRSVLGDSKNSTLQLYLALALGKH